MGRTSRKIPINWTNYEPIGEPIGDSRLFAFKTPLYPELQKKVAKSNRFTTLDLIQKLSFSGRSLGLVIDCNNTRRYYSRRDFEGIGVNYKDIACPGRGFLDRTDIVKLFINTVDEFLTKNTDNDLLIGVNCGNGINRSGYLVCNYLITRLGWSSHDALNAFENMRGYPIERGSYIQALHRADRERRNKSNALDEDKTKEDIMSKRNKKEKLMGSTDPLTSQIMQRFFNMEQQFKQIAETTVTHSSVDSSTALNINDIVPKSNTLKSSSKLQIAKDEIGEVECISEEEIDNESSSNIDFDSMGRVDVVEPASKSQQRRQRRQKRETMFAVMKKGRFWEINEMRKEMQND